MIKIPFEIKQLLNQDCEKNIRIVFPDNSHEDITNKDIQKESLEFEEHTCSSKELKFGLCEGSRISFIGYEIGDITNKTIKAYVEVYCSGEEEGSEYKEDIEQFVYAIPLGIFTVNSCTLKKVVNKNFYKINAYTLLNSEVLDVDISEWWHETFANGKTMTVMEMFDLLLPNHQLTKREELFPSADIEIGYIADNVALPDRKVKYASISYDVSSYDVVSVYDAGSYRYVLRNLYNDLKANYSYYYKVRDSKMFGAFAVTTSDNGTDYNGCYSLLGYGDAFEKKGTLENYMSFNGIKKISFNLPLKIVNTNESTTYWESTYSSYSEAELKQVISINLFSGEINPLDLKILQDIEDTDYKFTLRDILTSYYEINCLFGKIGRTNNLFYGEELNKGMLLPSSTLYPNDLLYPRGTSSPLDKNVYNSLLAAQKENFRYLIYTYLLYEEVADEGEDSANPTNTHYEWVKYTKQKTINTNGTKDYYMSDNWFFNSKAWSTSVGGDIEHTFPFQFADDIVSKMKDLSWVRFEADLVGLPYIESGDMVEIVTSEGTETTYILERNMKGIRNLTDSFFCGSVDTF